jgi:hypothetical protein
VRVESHRVGRAYAQLVGQTRAIAGREISRSWDWEPNSAAEGVHVRDIDLSALREFDEALLQEVRDELAVLPGWLRRAARRVWRFVRRRPEAEIASALNVQNRNEELTAVRGSDCAEAQ